MTQMREEIELYADITRQHAEIQDNSRNSSHVTDKYRLLPFKRFVLVLLLFLGSFFRTGIRNCMSHAIVNMTSYKTTVVVGNQTIHESEFDFDTRTIGWLLSCFNFAFGFACLPGGFLTKNFGGSVTFGVATIEESVLTILTPLCIELGGLRGFFACRIAAGVFDGISFASTTEIFSRWIPVAERSTCMAIVFSATYIGYLVSSSVFGYLAERGWKIIFYVAGGSTLIWSIIWTIVARNEPSADKFISRKELQYIVKNAETTPRNQIVHPYRKIITSSEVWALCIGKFTCGWGISMINNFFLLYVLDTTRDNLSTSQIILPILFLAYVLLVPTAGMIMGFLQKNTHLNLNPNQIHKKLMTFGYGASYILFAVAAFSANFALSMTCFVLIHLFLSFNLFTLELICIYMAPKHSSVLLGLSTFCMVVGQSIMLYAFGYILKTHRPEEWSICFVLSAGMSMLGGFSYFIFGSSERQPWAM